MQKTSKHVGLFADCRTLLLRDLNLFHISFHRKKFTFTFPPVLHSFPLHFPHIISLFTHHLSPSHITSPQHITSPFRLHITSPSQITFPPSQSRQIHIVKTPEISVMCCVYNELRICVDTASLCTNPFKFLIGISTVRLGDFTRRRCWMIVLLCQKFIAYIPCTSLDEDNVR